MLHLESHLQSMLPLSYHVSSYLGQVIIMAFSCDIPVIYPVVHVCSFMSRNAICVLSCCFWCLTSLVSCCSSSQTGWCHVIIREMFARLVLMGWLSLSCSWLLSLFLTCFLDNDMVSSFLASAMVMACLHHPLCCWRSTVWIHDMDVVLF